MRAVQTVCPYCGVGCGITCDVQVESNEIVAVRGIPEHPVSQGSLCVKGKTAHEFVRHPDRLTQPLKRLRDSREHKFVPVSWHQAVTEIAAKLLELRRIYGPDSSAFFSSSRCTSEENYLLQKLARIVIGTNNIDNCARLCHSTIGSGVMTNSITDLETADCILILGSNTTEAHPLIGKKVLNAQKRGASVIVADPRRTTSAKNRDSLRHRPSCNGTCCFVRITNQRTKER